MGSNSRYNRAQRFIAEFDAQWVRKHGFCAVPTSYPKPINITVKSDVLEFIEGEESVRYVVTLQDHTTNKEYRLLGESIIFDPEHDYGSDLVERVAEQLGISEDEARARCAQAKIL